MTFDFNVRLSMLGAEDFSGKLQNIAQQTRQVGTAAGELGPKATVPLENLDKGVNKVGVSAAQTAAAMRGLPAQITDIVTSIQGGQAPLTVFLQQGGQLKDMFGGALPAAKALGGYILGLVNPYTLAAAAALGLAYAHEVGAEEARNFERQLIMNGRSIGVTTSQLMAMAAQLDQLDGVTQHQGAAGLSAMIAAGVKGREALTDFTAAALEMERAGGQSIEQTAKAFGELAKDPVTAVKKLNEANNFLTLEVYAQIKALQEQGKETEAAGVAQRAYADMLKERTPQMEAQLGLLERGWRSIKEATRDAGDAILSIGRADGLEQALQKARARLESAQTGIYSRDKVGERQQEVQALEKGAGYAALGAYYEQQAAEQRKKGIAWLDAENGYLTRQQQLAKDILKVRNAGVEAGISEAEIQQRINILVERADPGVNLQRVKDAESLKLQAVAAAQQQIDLLRSTGFLNERAAIEATTVQVVRSYDVRIAATQQELQIAQRKQNNEREVAALQGQLSILAAQRALAEVKGRDDVTIAIYRQRQAIDAVIRAQQDETRQEQADYFVRESKAREAVAVSSYEWEKALKLEAAQLDIERDSLLGSARARDLRLEQLRIETELRKRLDEIDRTVYEGGEPEREEARNRVRAASLVALNQAAARSQLDEWRRVSQGVYDSLTDALTRAFRTGKGFAQAFRDAFVGLWEGLVLRPLAQQVAGLFGQGLVSLVGSILPGGVAIAGGGSAARGGGAAGALQLAGTASSLYSSGSTLYGLGSQLIGGTMSGANVAGTLYANATGTGLDGLLAANGAYGTAGGAAAGSSAAGGTTLGTAASWAAWAALIYAGVQKASSDYDQGFRQGGSRQVSKDTGVYAFGGFEADFANLLKGIGLSSKWANILSGATAVAKIFGRADPRIEQQGVTGTLGGGDFSGQLYAQMLAKGGLFRSDKRWDVYQALPKDLEDTLDAGAKAVLATAKSYADALGLPAESLSKITTKARITFTGQAEADIKAIDAAMGDYAKDLTGSLATALRSLARYGETDQDMIKRLVALQSFSRGLADLGGVFGRVASLSVDAREQLIAFAGGMDSLKSQAQQFVQDYYNRDEIAGLKAREIQSALKAAGITQDISSRSDFRSLVEGVDVSTEAGRQQLATLLSLSSGFTSVADYLSQSGLSLSQAAAQAPAAGSVASLLAGTDQVAAINVVADNVTAVRDAIVDLTDLVRQGATISPGGGAVIGGYEVNPGGG